MVSRDPELFFRLHPTHIALDEAQLLGEIFQLFALPLMQTEKPPADSLLQVQASQPHLLYL